MICIFLVQELIELDVDGNEIGDKGIRDLVEVHRIFFLINIFFLSTQELKNTTFGSSDIETVDETSKTVNYFL